MQPAKISRQQIVYPGNRGDFSLKETRHACALSGRDRNRSPHWSNFSGSVLVQLSDALTDCGRIKAAEARAVLFNPAVLSVFADLATDPAAGTSAPLVALRHNPIVARLD